MGTENDIESFIQLQKQKLAQERESLHQKSDFGQESSRSKISDYKPSDSIPTQKERAQWQAPSQPQIKQDPQYSSSLNFGSYDQKRKKLDEERKRDYNERDQRAPVNKNQRNSPRNNNEGDGGMFSKLGQYESKRKVLDVERQNEYNKKLTASDFRRTGQQANFSDPGLPGLRDHPSADHQKIKQRNAEYNEFLRTQEQKRNNRFADKKGFPVETAPPGRSEYDRTLRAMLMPEPSRIGQQQRTPRRQATHAEQITPRRSQANPSYEQLLEEKRRQEQSYRRRNDPEAVHADTHRTHPPAGRFGNEERRFDDLDRQYERRKVKFANDRSYEDDNADVYDWEYSNHGRSRSFYQDPEPKYQDPYERSRSVPPKEEAMTGLAIGHSETASAARRRKDQYRQDLEQQMNSSRRAKPQQFGRGEISRENDYPPLFSNPISQAYPAPKIPGFSDQSGSLLDDRRPLASILNERRDLVDTSPRGNAVRLGLGPGVLQSGFTGLYEPSALSRQHQQQYPPPVGYGQQPYGGPPQPYQTPSDPAYNHYATQDPLASFTAPPLGPPQYPNTSQPKYPQNFSQQPPAAQSFNTNSAAVGAFPSERTDKNQQKKDSQQTYQNELRRQMEEKQRYQAAKKAEQEAYEKKLNEEIANYNPFGRGGAGAPMKDSTGNVVADLRSMKLGNTGLTPRPDIQNTPAPVSVNLSSFSSALPDLNLSAGADTLDVGHARGGHGIFGEPKTDVQKTAADKYKDELRKQIEEKKRVVELEKQKLKEEEEREMKRLEEDRIKIQKEFEAEQAKAKAKEEETRRKNEEMKQAAEEKRKLAEQQREQADEKRNQKDAEARQREQKEREEEERRQREAKNKNDNRADSPPIPTLRSKTQPPGSIDLRENSPPLPTQRSKTQHDSTLTGSRPVIRDEEPPTSYAPEPAKRPQSRVQKGKKTPIVHEESAEVLNQLAHMRQQLHQERQRVENALNKQKLDVDVYDSRTGVTGNDSPSDIDVFEIARSKKPVSARKARADNDSQSGGQTPIAKPQTATSLLQSDSAFIDDRGMRAAFPDDFDTLASHQNARRRRRERLQPSQEDEEFRLLMRDYIKTPETPGDMLKHYQRQNNPRQPRKRDAESVHSVDPDRITRKNQERLRKLKAIAGDDISLDDPDDIIDRFMTKQSHNRPPSGQTLTDETWINSNVR